ncbi:MAG: hypothetical protein HYV39_03450 [Candidatus Levybacteria bacterium]|nr:hypothetical protein [Candidatus Levybacteria bacterium]
MENGIISKIRDILDKQQTINIAVGKNPNLDEMAAALGFYLSCKADGKQVTIASPTEPLVEISSLVGIDKVGTSFTEIKGDLTVSFPYTEGEIEKVSYTLENGYLNIIVKAGAQGLPFSEKDVSYKRGGAVLETLFIIGTAKLSDLGNLFDTQSLKNTTVVNIDNKNGNQGFGDIVHVSSIYSSVSEQMANLLVSLNLPLDMDIAQNLLSGMIFATDNFQNVKTSPLAFEMAAILLRKGATRQRLPKTPGRIDASSQPGGGKVFRPKSPFPFPQRQSQQRPSYQAQSQFSIKNVPPPFIEQKEQEKEEDIRETPPDWLTPKVYKGSTLV